MLGVSSDAPLVFAFGRLVEKKGFAHLIDAAAILKRDYPSLRVVIAGEGDLGATLRARAEAAGVAELVHLMGVVPQHVVPTLLAAADVAVAPSIHDEAGNVDGLPNAVMEIMASGTPLVTTRAGGIGAVATDNQTARLVAERDAGALAGALADLLQHPSQGAEIARRARETVCREYSWARMTDAFEAIYERVGGNAGAHRRG
jgi:glycosyltransferase involved in cell wall biosynthesis